MCIRDSRTAVRPAQRERQRFHICFQAGCVAGPGRKAVLAQPVSYTHLDVYKRQSYNSGNLDQKFESGKNIAKNTRLMFDAKSNDGFIVKAVSYTHLDVYKRQCRGRLPVPGEDFRRFRTEELPSGS